ncbi:MAG: HupE/UreJ family protein [Cyanobacteriota bacterium]|jgi:urease accessory protein|nr:HupE/UreJ family protein [Cyanobacteriota bacterium]
MTPTFSNRGLTLLGTASALALVLAGLPAQAHGIADTGLASGFLHPLLGIDHLLLLVGLGTVAAVLHSGLLLWGLAGALAGGTLGQLGASLPGQEFLAALAVSGLGLMVLLALKTRREPQLSLYGALISTAVAVHALLHGLEAPSGQAPSWWLGAAAASLLVSGASWLLLRRLPLGWSQAIGLLLAVSGGALGVGLALG